MPKRPPKQQDFWERIETSYELSGPGRFARDFGVLLAQEKARAGKPYEEPTWLIRWTEQVLRGSGGDLDRLGKIVGWKLYSTVYGPPKSKEPNENLEKCYAKGRAFARRHKRILAEQVLAGNVADLGVQGLYDTELVTASPPCQPFFAPGEGRVKYRVGGK